MHTRRVQTERRWEVIIVDDASTAGSVEQLREMTAADARVRIIQLKENKGDNYCRNLGIEQARAPYVIQVDADDLRPHGRFPVLRRNLNNSARRLTRR